MFPQISRGFTKTGDLLLCFGCMKSFPIFIVIITSGLGRGGGGWRDSGIISIHSWLFIRNSMLCPKPVTDSTPQNLTPLTDEVMLNSRLSFI